MLKILIIFFTVFYLIYKVGGFLLRGFFVSSPSHQAPHQKKSRKVPNSDLNIDYIPKNKKKSKKDYPGGEYVDYEEV